jgi:hypothetical protein
VFGQAGRKDDVSFVSPDGRTLYIVSGRPSPRGGAPAGTKTIRVMNKTGEAWSEARPLPAVINSVSRHWQVSIDQQWTRYSGAGGDLYWVSTSIIDELRPTGTRAAGR